MAPLRAMACMACIISSTFTVAHAAPDKAKAPTDRVQFVDMSEMLIDGRIVRPQVLKLDARAKVKFDRLFELKRAVLPQLQQTARDRALR